MITFLLTCFIREKVERTKNKGFNEINGLYPWFHAHSMHTPCEDDNVRFRHPWPFSKSKFNLKSDRVNLVAPASPIKCLLYLPNVRAIQYKLGPGPGSEIQMYYGCPWICIGITIGTLNWWKMWKITSVSWL